MTLAARNPNLSDGYLRINYSELVVDNFLDTSILGTFEQNMQQMIRHTCARDLVNEFYKHPSTNPRQFAGSYSDVIALYGPIEPNPGFQLKVKIRADCEFGYNCNIHTFVHRQMWNKHDFFDEWLAKNTDTRYWQYVEVGDIAYMEWRSMTLQEPDGPFYISIWFQVVDEGCSYVTCDGVYIGEECLT